MANELPTPTELVQIGQAKIRSLQDPQGTGAVNLHPGSRWDLALSAFAALAARNTAHIADRVAARSLVSAVDDDLDIIAADLFNDGRLPAAAATTTVYLQRSGTAATVIPNGTRFVAPAVPPSTAAVNFTATQDVSVAQNTLKVAVPVACTQAGVIGNLAFTAAGQNPITTIQDTLGDTTWALYTPTAGDSVLGALAAPPPIGGGADQETNDQLRARLKQAAFDDSKKRGTKRALIVGAAQVPGVLATSIVPIEPGDGTVKLFCGDVNYNLPPALQTAVASALENWRAFGVPVFVLPYAITVVTITGTIYMQRPLVNYNTAAITAQAVANIISYFTNRQQADEYFLNQIIGSCEQAHPEVQTAILTSPTADVRRLGISGGISNYSGVTTIPRYIVNSSSIFLSVAGPLTQ